MIWSLQVLRFVAALMVTYVHTGQSAMAITGYHGSVHQGIATIFLSGVDIFFVISGVIIAKVAVGRTASEFWRSRLVRIMPLYLICGIPYLIVAAVAHPAEVGWRLAIASFLLWPATDVMTVPALGVAWTLAFEMLFYGAATLVILQRNLLYVLLAAFAAATVLRHQEQPVFQFIGNPIIMEFLFGVVIARLPVWRWSAAALPIGIAALLLVGLTGIGPAGNSMDFLIGRDGWIRVLLYGFPAAMIVYGTMKLDASKGVWSYLGGASYSLYLTHVPIIATLGYFWSATTPADMIVIVGVVASICFACRIHERIEKPILKMLKPRLPMVQTGPWSEQSDGATVRVA